MPSIEEEGGKVSLEMVAMEVSWERAGAKRRHLCRRQPSRFSWRSGVQSADLSRGCTLSAKHQTTKVQTGRPDRKQRD